MDLQIKNKLALVSGSTGGIGFAIASALAAEGARVVINGRMDARVREAREKILKAYPQALLEDLAVDLGTVAGAEEAYRKFHDVEILVNNLGFYEPKTFENITDEDWLRMIEVNFLSGVRLSRYYLAGMRKKNWGRIVFVSSESAVQIPKEMIHYGVTKTMQLALSRGLAETTSGTGVTVNSVLPGPTRSEGVDRFVEDMAKAKGVTPEVVEKEFFANVRPTSLLQRFATVDEVAALVAFVCSPLSSATNGAALRVDGGVVRSMV